MIARPRIDATDIAEVSERGRGLLLVDHFASRWGTTHQPTGKGVWFRLDRKHAAPGANPGTNPGRSDPATVAAGPLAGASDPPPERAVPSAGALSALMQTAPDPYSDDPLPEFAGNLLARIGEMLGAAGGSVRLDRGDGAGDQLLARYGRQPRSGDALVRVPLAVNRPYSGNWNSTRPPRRTPGRWPP